MKTRIAVLLLLVTSSTAFAQRGAATRANTSTPGPAHDPHDLSGVWLSAGGGGGAGAASQWRKESLPPITAEGATRMKANIPAKGPRGVVPAKANDPIGE